MSSPNPTHTSSPSQIPTPLRSMSRNNSNISVASSSNRGELNSTISTATTSNSIASSYKSHLSKTNLKTLVTTTAGTTSATGRTSSISSSTTQPADQKQSLLNACGSSTPIRSFQRATISSVVKTRAFDNNPMLQSLLAASSPINNKSSVSNSQTPSPHSTPVFSRSRSLRMSGGPSRYSRNSPSQFYRNSSRTPDVHYSFNSRDSHSIEYSNCELPAPVRLAELTHETLELKESLEFSEIERQAFEDTTRELKTILHNERSQWKKELEDMKKQFADLTAARVKAESQLVQKDVELNDLRLAKERTKNELDKNLAALQRSLDRLQEENKQLRDMNEQLKEMMAEKLKYNGIQSNDDSAQHSKCISIVTEMARLRLDVNAKDKLLQQLDTSKHSEDEEVSGDYLAKDKKENYCPTTTTKNQEMDILNKFLNETVECIKSWPEDLANSDHVQTLMKTLLKAYR